MATMTVLPRSRAFTAADLEQMPDDGNRYELIDGALVVTPSPAVPHQRVVGNLHVLLRSACPPEVEVMLAPLDVTVSDRTVLQPDLLVATREALSGRRMTGLPLLAVEVLSPSTRLIDLELKRAAYEAAGTESYWVVDPDAPSVTVWQRTAERRHDRTAHVEGEDVLLAQAPYAVRVVPAELVR